MYALAVKIILCLGLLACVGIACIILAKTMTAKEGRGTVLKFLVVEVLLFAFVVVVLFLVAGPPGNIGGFLFGSVFLTMLANIPAVIVAKIIGIFLGRGTPSTPPQAIPCNGASSKSPSSPESNIPRAGQASDSPSDAPGHVPNDQGRGPPP